jgi:hypothetical protein
VTRVGSRCACSGSLHTLLDEGWKIEPPVYARPHWQSASNSKTKKRYHFVLWRDNQVNLVSIPESPEIQQVLVEHGLAVDRL